MTIKSNQNVVYNSTAERITAARTELGMAGDITHQIYQSRQLEPDENQLIKNFYYSIYHFIKGISIIDTGKEYHSHHALISYFNRESRKANFLHGVCVEDLFRSGLDRLFVLRDQYDYRERYVDEEDYLEAEQLWEKMYPELENILTALINSEGKAPKGGSGMRKKLPVIIGICIFVYIGIFLIIMVGTHSLPSYVYENEKLIAKDLNSFNKINYRGYVKDGITTVTCEKMTGMEIVWNYNAPEDMTMQMNYTLQVARGKAKLVLIQPGKTTVTLVEQSSAADKDAVSDTTSATEQQCTLDLKKGENKIKIVCGKGTSFSLSFDVENNVEI